MKLSNRIYPGLWLMSRRCSCSLPISAKRRSTSAAKGSRFSKYERTRGRLPERALLMDEQSQASTGSDKALKLRRRCASCSAEWEAGRSQLEERAQGITWMTR